MILKKRIHIYHYGSYRKKACQENRATIFYKVSSTYLSYIVTDKPHSLIPASLKTARIRN